MSFIKISMVMALCFSTAFTYVHSAEMGRFFTTPEERAELNAMRKIGPPEVVAKKKEESIQLEPEEVIYEDIHLQGIVKRNDGMNTVWVDGKPIDAGKVDKQGIIYSVDKDNSALIKIPGETQPAVKLQSGMHYEPMNNKVKSSIDSSNIKQR